MMTWLDRQIEQLEFCVERCMSLCNATWNGMQCMLPANHSVQPHRFRGEFPMTAATLTFKRMHDWDGGNVNPVRPAGNRMELRAARQ
jgi:hypothetical protein